MMQCTGACLQTPDYIAWFGSWITTLIRNIITMGWDTFCHPRSAPLALFVSHSWCAPNDGGITLHLDDKDHVNF